MANDIGRMLAQFGQAMLQVAQQQERLNVAQQDMLLRDQERQENMRIAEQNQALRDQRTELLNFQTAQGVVQDFIDAHVQQAAETNKAASEGIEQKIAGAEKRFNTAIRTLNRFSPNQKMDSGAVLTTLVASQAKDPQVRAQLMTSLGGEAGANLNEEQQATVDDAVDTALGAFKVIKEQTKAREQVGVVDTGQLRQEAMEYIVPRVSKRFGIPEADLGMVPTTTIPAPAGAGMEVGGAEVVEPPLQAEIDNTQASASDVAVARAGQIAARIEEIDQILLARSSGPNAMPVTERIALRQERENLVAEATRILSGTQAAAETAAQNRGE